MFRVTGRDARGNTREFSVCASTEEEARAFAERDGIVAVDRVAVPPPLPPSRFPKLSGFARGGLAFLGFLAATVLGTVAGGMIASEAELPAGPDERAMNAFFGVPSGLRTDLATVQGALVGAGVGFIVGVAILVASYRRHRALR